MMSDYPDIPEGHFLVFAAEAKTGIRLNVLGEYHEGREGEEYLFWIFDSLEKADEFGHYHLDKKPGYEFTIMDSKKKVINVIRK